MSRQFYRFVLGAASLAAGIAVAQNYPMLDMMADGVVQRYQQSNCEQLWAKKGQPKTAQQQEAIQMLRNDPARRTEFINRVAGPIVNKMFECGMIP